MINLEVEKISPCHQKQLGSSGIDRRDLLFLFIRNVHDFPVQVRPKAQQTKDFVFKVSSLEINQGPRPVT